MRAFADEPKQVNPSRFRVFRDSAYISVCGRDPSSVLHRAAARPGAPLRRLRNHKVLPTFLQDSTGAPPERERAAPAAPGALRSGPGRRKGMRVCKPVYIPASLFASCSHAFWPLPALQNHKVLPTFSQGPPRGATGRPSWSRMSIFTDS